MFLKQSICPKHTIFSCENTGKYEIKNLYKIMQWMFAKVWALCLCEKLQWRAYNSHRVAFCSSKGCKWGLDRRVASRVLLGPVWWPDHPRGAAWQAVLQGWRLQSPAALGTAAAGFGTQILWATTKSCLLASEITTRFSHAENCSATRPS